MTEPSQTPAAAAALALSGDPSTWGRVSEDGTVFVRTAEGEKAVGSYPGKSNAEALEYFVRKFETVAAEVALTGARIRSGAMVPEDAAKAIARLRTQVAGLNAVGDLAALAAAVEEMVPLIEERKVIVAAEKAAAREAARAKKEEIVAEAEKVAAKDSWKASGDRLKELLDEWKKVPRIDKKSDEELWKRFSAARNGFDKRRRAHFAELDQVRTTVSSTKEKLVAEAEKLATSKDWLNTARKFKTLMDQWKAAGRGAKNDDDRLWARFKAAQDQFFAAKKADLEQREASYSANKAAKSNLITQIEAIAPVTDAKAARKAFRSLMDQWEKIGPVSRGDKEKFDNRINTVQSAIKEAEQVEYRRSDPTAKARAADAVRQLEESIANYEAQAAKASASGDEKKANAARDAAAARREWLAEAQKTLNGFL